MRIAVIILFSLLLSACTHLATSDNTLTKQDSQTSLINTPTPTMPTTNPKSNNQPVPDQNPAQQAVVSTSMGDITIKLFPDSAPLTVANFAGLSEGTKPWTDPSTGEAMENTPLYTGTIFHRVIEGFMIQGGDPLGTGTGGPGYRFADEIDPNLKFDKPYILAMANSGPSTNGSQFFITVAPTPWLNGKHTIFGEVTGGQDIVDKIATTQTGPGDKPVEDITVDSIAISR